jgi:hypothetical protein
MQRAATLSPGPFRKGKSLKMSITNSNIATELISDFAGGRLDAEDAQVIREAINHDEVRQLSQMRVGSARECTYGWQHRQQAPRPLTLAGRK